MPTKPGPNHSPNGSNWIVRYQVLKRAGEIQRTASRFLTMGIAERRSCLCAIDSDEMAIPD